MIMHFVAHWFWYITGARNEASAPYGLWSGIGGALPDVCLLTGLAAWYWHRTCHVSHCWRPGKHHVDGTPWCNRHHIAARRKLAATGSAHDLRERM